MWKPLSLSARLKEKGGLPGICLDMFLVAGLASVDPGLIPWQEAGGGLAPTIRQTPHWLRPGTRPVRVAVAITGVLLVEPLLMEPVGPEVALDKLESLRKKVFPPTACFPLGHFLLPPLEGVSFP